MSSTERSGVADALSAGMDTWSNALDAQRQFLEQLSGQVRDAVTSNVDVTDLQQVLAALQLLEARTAAAESREQANAARLDALDARLMDLTEQVGIVARAVGALGEQVGRLADASTPTGSKPRAKKSRTSTKTSDA